MKVTLPDRVSGSRDALLVLEVEFPVATEERKVAIEITGPLQALDLQGGQAGGSYPVPVGLERLHIPLRVTTDGAGEAKVVVRCTEGPESGETAQRTLTLEAPQMVAAGGGGTRMALIGLLLAGLAAGGVILAPKFFGGTRVPGVEGKTEADALAALKGAGYVVARPALEDVQDRSQHGKVLRTIPPGGERLAKGARVEVVLGSFGATQLLVPNVLGSPKEAALASLKAMGFDAEVRAVAAERPEDAGRVVRQIPPGGESVDRGVAVQLRVADLSITPTPPPVDPPTPVPVPTPPIDPPIPDPVVPTPPIDPPTPDPVVPAPPVDPPTPPVDPPTPNVTIDPEDGRIALPKLVGLAEAEAHRQLEELGTFAVVRMKPTAVPEEVGQVLAQDPAPATRIHPTEAITISVGIRGAGLPIGPVVPDPAPIPDPDPVPTPAPDRVAVPDLIGLSESDALRRISAAGLRSVTETETTDDVPAGQILSQEPGAGTQLEKDGVVTMIVAEPPATPAPGPGPGPSARKTVLVPDIMNMKEAEARQRLEDEGLGVVIKRESGPAMLKGIVASQRPDPDTRVATGSLVEITVIGEQGEPDPVPPVDPPTPVPPVDPPTPVPPVDPPTPVDPVPPTRVPGVDPNNPDVRERDRVAADIPKPDMGNLPPPAVGRGVFRAPPPQRVGAPPPPERVNLPGRDAPASLTMPDLVGLSAQDAITNSLQSGLLPIVSVDRAGGGSAHRISSQSPAVGQQLKLGDFIRLQAPMGGSTEEQTYDLRFFVGELAERVVPMFQRAGVQVSVIEVDSPKHPYAGKGRVVAQYPMYSVPVSQARFVTLWVVRAP